MTLIYIDNNTAKYSFTELGRNEVLTPPIYNDDLSGLSYFFAKIPIAHLSR